MTTNNLKSKIEEKVNSYLLQLRKEWEDTILLTIRKAKIEALILDIDGVIDISNLTMNSGKMNIILEQFEIPILKEVIVQ